MKFKMAPNSGFAMLLRAPWWVSWALAAVIVLGCFALLPAHLALFAAAGALPIGVIGIIAAWRQWRAPSSARLQAQLDMANALTGAQWADWLTRAWSAEGYVVQTLGSVGTIANANADLRLERGGQAILVSLRRCKAANHGVEPLRALWQEQQRQGAQGSVYVLLQGQLTDGAQAFAKEQSLVLLQGADLATLLLRAQAYNKVGG